MAAPNAKRQHADASSAKARDSEKKQLRAKTKRPPRKRLLIRQLLKRPLRPLPRRKARPLPPLRPLLRLKPPRPRKRRKPPLPRLMPLLRLKRRLPRPRRPRPPLPRKVRPRLRKTRRLPTPCRKRPPCRPCPRAPNTARPSLRKPFRPSKRPFIIQKTRGEPAKALPFCVSCFLARVNFARQLRQRRLYLSAAGLPAAAHFGQRGCDSIPLSLPDGVSATIRKECHPRWQIFPKQQGTAHLR